MEFKEFFTKSDIQNDNKKIIELFMEVSSSEILREQYYSGTCPNCNSNSSKKCNNCNNNISNNISSNIINNIYLCNEDCKIICPDIIKNSQFNESSHVLYHTNYLQKVFKKLEQMKVLINSSLDSEKKNQLRLFKIETGRKYIHIEGYYEPIIKIELEEGSNKTKELKSLPTPLIEYLINIQNYKKRQDLFKILINKDISGLLLGTFDKEVVDHLLSP